MNIQGHEYAFCFEDEQYQYTATATGSGNNYGLFYWGTSGWNNGTQIYVPGVFPTGVPSISAQVTTDMIVSTNLTGDNARSDWGVYNNWSLPA